MTAVINSLKVEGNIPCPTPTHSGPPLLRRKSSTMYQNPSERPVKLRPSATERHINTDEELKNILLQAKAPDITGPTPVAKRMCYLSRIKQLNDGMYKQNVLTDSPKRVASHPQVLSLEGKKLDSQSRNDTFGIAGVNVENDNNIQGLPYRSVKSSLSAKSTKSHSSTKSVKSEPSSIYKPLALPMLTIGSEKHKTEGEYIGECKDPSNSLADIALSKEAMRNENVNEYEFRFQTPRKFRLRGEFRDKSPDKSGNYDSLSLSDLKACLHVNHSKERSHNQDKIIQDYMKEIKSKQPSLKVNPYKMLKSNAKRQAKEQQQLHLSSRYEFKNVDSYLKYHQNKTESSDERPAVLASSQSTSNRQVYSDTALLQMMSELNNPAPRQATVAACRLSGYDSTDLLQIRQPLTDRSLHPKNFNSSSVNTNSSHFRKRNTSGDLGAQNSKQITQHIVYVPSGQTAKVRLIHSSAT